MLPYFLLGLGLLAGGLLTVRWFASAEPHVVKRVLFRGGLGILLVVIVFPAVTGRLTWAFIALPALLPWFMRLRSAATAARNYSRMGGAGAQQNSAIETRFLRMSLDHGTGDVAGDVIAGRFAGHSLASLTLADLALLWREVQSDPQSVQVLEAYLDRVHPGWRDGGAGSSGSGADADTGAAGGSASGTMSRAQAYEILGLPSGASADEVRAAHHRLMTALHPDRGGSTWLAAQLNQARDLLLKG